MRVRCMPLLAAFRLAVRMPSYSIHLLRILWQGAHVSQVSADLIVVAARVVKAEMFCDSLGHHPEQVACHLKGVPCILAAGVRVGLLQHGPEFRLKVLLEIFPVATWAAYKLRLHAHIPGEHLH